MLNTIAETRDTLTLSEYLELFEHNFTTNFKITGISVAKNKIILSFDSTKYLQNISIKLDNGIIISPEIYGYAYSYRKINPNLYWIIYYNEVEVGTSMFLCILNFKNKLLSNPYTLVHYGGDDGYWDYKYGNFINDSTYNYLYVWGNDEKTLDSLTGLDRIKMNGEFIELKKKSLIEITRGIKLSILKINLCPIYQNSTEFQL